MDVCVISFFVVILMASGQCIFSSVRILEELDHVCKEIWLVTFIFAGMKRV